MQNKAIVNCQKCYGSGKVLGGGMMPWTCDGCDGSGKVTTIKAGEELLPKLDKPKKKLKE